VAGASHGESRRAECTTPRAQCQDGPETHGQDGHATKKRLPHWLRRDIPAGAASAAVRGVLAELHLATVCTSARCPNRAECFARGRATFMILGATCTRACAFCAVASGQPEAVREDEPQAVAEACARLELRHVVITSVTRDDLPDGGAEQFARTIAAVRSRLIGAVIEVLTPDFAGSIEAIDCVLDAGCDVFNHNVETVPRLQAVVRPRASYARSLGVLAHAAKRRETDLRSLHTKSGLMVGLGETPDEIAGVMADLRAVGCDILTIGQYLQPTGEHLPVARYVPPEEFAELKRLGREMGFAAVAAGPLVRSSYHAEEVFRSAL